MKDTFIKDKTNPIIPVHFNLQMLSIKDITPCPNMSFIWRFISAFVITKRVQLTKYLMKHRKSQMVMPVVVRKCPLHYPGGQQECL